MKASSLRVRLLAGAALWIVLALVLTGVAILYLFAAGIETSTRIELEAGAARLTALIDIASPDRISLTEAPPDPRYDIPLSGYYWQIARDDEAMLRSRSLWDFVIAYDGPAGTHGVTGFNAAGPDGQSLSAVALDATFLLPEGETTYRIIVAQDRAVLDESIARFGRDLVLALLILGLALVVAVVGQVRLGLRPLRSLRRDIESIRTGSSNEVAASYPAEVLPLVAEVNALLTSQQRQIEFARRRAADLAHGLKTPLAVMGTVADQLRDKQEDETADLIDELVSEMGERVDYQLRLSRLRQRTRTQVLDTRLDEVLARIVSVIRRTGRGEGLDWRIDFGGEIHLDIDRNDLVELLGVVLENAAEWARTRVTVLCRSRGKDAEILISDDGGSLTAEQTAQLSQGDRRLDERSGGNGLGLGIVREIVVLNGGRLRFGLSPENGLMVMIYLPRAEPARSGR